MLYNNDICQNFPDYDSRNRLRANSPEGSKFFLSIGGTKITKNVKGLSKNPVIFIYRFVENFVCKTIKNRQVKSS